MNAFTDISIDREIELHQSELFLKPTYAVILPYRERRGRQRTNAQLLAQENLKHNKRTEEISRKTMQRISTCINWLLLSSQSSLIYCKKTNRKVRSTMSFVTLTLPTTEHNISDNFFKNKLLGNFLSSLREVYGMRSYVWRVESQANGNIHAHVMLNQYVHHGDVRRLWNSILVQTGTIETYQNKHIVMSEQDYIKAYSRSQEIGIKKLKSRFQIGLADNWENPNTTDIKAVKNIKDVAKYFAKYMSKTEEDRRTIGGKCWGASQNISSAKIESIVLDTFDDQEVLKPLEHPKVQRKRITLTDKITQLEYTIGQLFTYSFEQVKTFANTVIGQAFANQIVIINNT